jgi:hypothetical protein
MAAWQSSRVCSSAMSPISRSRCFPELRIPTFNPVTGLTNSRLREARPAEGVHPILGPVLIEHADDLVAGIGDPSEEVHGQRLVRLLTASPINSTRRGRPEGRVDAIDGEGLAELDAAVGAAFRSTAAVVQTPSTEPTDTSQLTA